MGLSARRRKRYGPRGLGEIRVLKDRIKVLIQNDDGKTDIYELAPEDVENVDKNVKGVYIELTPDETDVRSVRPWNGTFVARFVEFIKTREGAISLKTKQARQPSPEDYPGWTIPAHAQFYAMVEILSRDKHKGMTIIVPLVYLFERTVDGIMEIVYDYKPHYSDLKDFLMYAGYDFENDVLLAGEPTAVLDQLEEILQEKDQNFTVKIEKGWFQELGEGVIGA